MKLHLLVVWNWRGGPVLFPHWHDVINDYPRVVASSEYLVYIFGTNVCHVLESGPRLLVIQTPTQSQST